MGHFRLAIRLAWVAAAAYAAEAIILPGINIPLDGPMSANVLGVDASGRTTLELVPGSPAGSYNSANFDFTVVAGPSDMSFSFTDTFYAFGGSEYCTIIPQVAGQGQSAICTAVIGTSTAVNTITVSDINIQGIGAPPAAAVVRRTGPSEVSLSQPTQAVNGGLATSFSVGVVLLSTAVLLTGVVW